MSWIFDKVFRSISYIFAKNLRDKSSTDFLMSFFNRA